jgi:hypothetical protein
MVGFALLAQKIHQPQEPRLFVGKRPIAVRESVPSQIESIVALISWDLEELTVRVEQTPSRERCIGLPKGDAPRRLKET